MAAFSFFKKKPDTSSATGELKINIPGMTPPAKKDPAPTKPAVNKAKAQRSCDEIYASQRNMRICPHCETIFEKEQRTCPACGLHF